jgi:tripartite-type tricarboxylate transporter receptor subunit TctC
MADGGWRMANGGRMKALAAALLLVAATCSAQGYPAKPIRFLIGFPPGGTNDILARALAPKLSEYLGQQVIIENRGGASTAIATELAARAAPDGYTILLNAPGHATNPALIKLNFDPVKDFAFITLLAESQNLLVVHPSLPVTSVKSLIGISKQRPGDINYGSSGSGTTPHMSAELFQFMTGTRWVHIPYKGSGLGLTALLGGEVSLYFANVPAAFQHVKAGRLRPIALSGTRRTPAAPGIPTIAESGLPGFAVTSWFGVAAPARTPRPIVERLNGEIVRALATPELRERMEGMGAEPVGNTPEEYTRFVQNEITKWGKVIKHAGIKGE